MEKERTEVEKELTELFESVKRAAEVAEKSPGEEDRCLDALKLLRKFPVNYKLLVSTQVGKRLRQLTKHKSNKIKTVASEVVEKWKGIIVKETMNNKKNGTVGNGDSLKPKPISAETNEVKKSTAKNAKLEISSSVKIEKKVEVVHKTGNGSLEEHVHIDKKIKVDNASPQGQNSTSDHVGPPKLTSLVYCKDPVRDKVREILAEALSKVPKEVSDDLSTQANSCDPNRTAVLVETAMFEKWGKSTGVQKAKYRSILFNIKDSNNPDFRRKILLGEFEPHSIIELSPEQMASNARQMENQKIKQKALFNSELGGAPQASTDQFTCGRCKKKETTYYQMQTRSADEPMTTFVTCVNCNNRWKFC